MTSPIVPTVVPASVDGPYLLTLAACTLLGSDYRIGLTPDQADAAVAQTVDVVVDLFNEIAARIAAAPGQ